MTIKYFFLTFITATLFVLSYSGVAGAQAQGELRTICNDPNNRDSALCKDYKDGLSDSNNNPVVEILADVVNLLTFAVGALVVIMIIYAGFKYTKSNGDSNKVSEAKNTLLYAIVGLVIALLANRLIIFILNWFFN